MSKKKDKNKNRHDDLESEISKLQKKYKRMPKIANDRDQIVYNPLRESKGLHHFNRPSPMMSEDVKNLKKNNKILKIGEQK